MNQSTDSSVLPFPSPDAVSRRAYDLWENEGRPAGCELRHWFQAETELGLGQSYGRSSQTSEAAIPSTNLKSTDSDGSASSTSGDVRPLPNTRTSGANRGGKRGSNAPFGGEKNPTQMGSSQSGRRRSSGAA